MHTLYLPCTVTWKKWYTILLSHIWAYYLEMFFFTIYHAQIQFLRIWFLFCMNEKYLHNWDRFSEMITSGRLLNDIQFSNAKLAFLKNFNRRLSKLCIYFKTILSFRMIWILHLKDDTFDVSWHDEVIEWVS